MATLEIKLLGLLSLESDGRPLVRCPSRKVKDLLAYLLLNRRSPQSREQLAGLLWAECDGERARHCLNTTLWRLRTVLQAVEDDGRPLLRIDAQSIGINPSGDFRMDVADFEAALANADRAGPSAADQQAAWHHAAVDCYRGDLLMDCYDDWCLVERERLLRLYLSTLSHLLAYHRDRHEHEPAVGCARRILACDPLREKVHRDLIQLHLDAGDPSAAFRQYELCEAVVRRELGTAVMPETRALLAQLLQQLAPPAQQLPISVVRAPADGRAPSGTTEIAVALARVEEAARMLHHAQAQVTEAAALLRSVQQQLRRNGIVIRPTWLVPDADKPRPRRLAGVP